MESIQSYLQKAAGQLACARDFSAELLPLPLELTMRLRKMVEEVEWMQREFKEYEKRHKK
jgi:hypothetical protein